MELNKLDNLNVKEECELKVEFQDEAVTTGVVDLSRFPAKHTKCGEVLISKENTFILICTVCENLYASIFDFGKHFVERHLYTAEVPERTAFLQPHQPNDVLQKSEKNKVNPVLPEMLADEPLISIEPSHSQNEQEQTILAETLPEIEVKAVEEVVTTIEEPKKTDSGVDYQGNDLNSSDDSSDVESGSDYKPQLRKSNKTTKTPDQKLFCELCNRQYKSAITYSRHQNKLHNEKKKRSISLKCRYCDMELATEKEFKEHKNTHDRLRPFQCPQCPKTFTSSNHRQKHINMHMGVRPYKCSKCPSAFGTECNLRQHMLTHAVAGPLSCHICGKQFIHQSRKDVHMRSHTGEKPFQCELCGRKFIIRSRLTEHMKRHNNTRNHECEICGKKFYTNVMLKHHQVAHSSDRPFECNECGKTFPRKLSLKMHRKIHSEVKQYSCNICGKEFRQYAGLYAHGKSHGEKKGLPKTNIAISDKFTPPTHLLIVRDENESDNDVS